MTKKPYPLTWLVSALKEEAPDVERLRLEVPLKPGKRPLKDGMAPAILSRIRIGKPDECWPWITRRGYGALYVNGLPYRANRVAFVLWFREDPGDDLVCHSCDNPPCCNPAHLFLGTPKMNTQDALRKGRLHSGERNKSSKLTFDKVLKAKILASKGVLLSIICSELGVSKTAISYAASGRTWRNVSGPVRIPMKRKDIRGEVINTAKLTKDQVLEIRKAFTALDWPGYVEMGKRYGVHEDSINNIIKRKTWTHL